MKFRADLHCHTYFSDGTDSPEELITLAKKSGLAAISITDHDTILAYETAIPIAKEQGILLGVGAEFSSTYETFNVHILGYDFDLENQQIQNFCQKHKERRKLRNYRILEKLRKKQMPIPEEELEKMGMETLGRPHIAKLMVKHKFVASMQQAFDQYIGDGKSCYDAGEPFTVDETLEVIHQARGKAFLAHPHFLGEGEKVFKLLDKPFDGIECIYANCLPQQEKRWIKAAERRNLLISGGSDYHGKIKPNITLGCSWVGDEIFYKIFQHAL